MLQSAYIPAENNLNCWLVLQDLAVNGIDDATKDMDVEREGSAGPVGKLMPLGAEAQLTGSH